MMPLYITDNLEWIRTDTGIFLKHEGIGFTCGVDLINNDAGKTREFLMECLEAYLQHDKIKV